MEEQKDINNNGANIEEEDKEKNTINEEVPEEESREDEQPEKEAGSPEEEPEDMICGDSIEEPEEGGGEETAEAAETAGGKKLFKKKAKTDKKQEALKQKVEELEDRVKRQMAEFDNFRKRTDKEKTAMYEIGAKSVIEKILPIVDNFERGLASISEEEKGNGFADGMQMIYKQLMTELENLGVKPIEAVGQEFNPDYHNAVMQVESEEYDTGIVAQELQKGYMYRDSVVRHSMVAVVS